MLRDLTLVHIGFFWEDSKNQQCLMPTPRDFQLIGWAPPFFLSYPDISPVQPKGESLAQRKGFGDSKKASLRTGIHSVFSSPIIRKKKYTTDINWGFS